jgi:hypothetical protein
LSGKTGLLFFELALLSLKLFLGDLYGVDFLGLDTVRGFTGLDTIAYSNERTNAELMDAEADNGVPNMGTF